MFAFFFSSRRRHTISLCDWSSDVCSSDLHRRVHLDAMARLCGFPGKVGMDGSEVNAAVQQGRLDDVRRYCETDVMNTFLRSEERRVGKECRSRWLQYHKENKYMIQDVYNE